MVVSPYFASIKDVVLAILTQHSSASDRLHRHTYEHDDLYHTVQLYTHMHAMALTLASDPLDGSVRQKAAMCSPLATYHTQHSDTHTHTYTQ